MPQMLSAVITIAGVFVSMLVLSPPLTLITVVMVICMVFATRTIFSKSGYYFVKQQTDVGNLTEVPERTGIWARKHYHKADDTTYQLMEGDVVFDHVDFGYTEDKEILHDIEIFARPGQNVAFVGATGAGKTTITNLVNGFYDVQDGKIRYDGININKIKKDDLRHSLGLVLQDTHLFTGTVMDRLMKGRTVFVIAHRLSTIKNSDVIMVLDHGRIVERGNHESLLAKKGMYYQLYTGRLEQE